MVHKILHLGIGVAVFCTGFTTNCVTTLMKQSSKL